MPKIFSKITLSKEQAESKNYCKPGPKEKKADKKLGILEFQSGLLGLA